jgi:DNA invertase Pin-like site-specific DNA recombinase
MAPRFVTYLRVSTRRQGLSGLGLDAQRAACAEYIRRIGGELPPLAEFVEIESGKNNARPQIKSALDLCRVTGAVLVIAKLDRLSRNAAFLLSLRDSGVEFVAADMPSANRLTVGILAVVAEAEREAISTRTTEALRAAKARGVRLGGDRGGRATPAARAAALAKRQEQAARFAALIAPHVEAARGAGCQSLRQIAGYFQERGILSPAGKANWTPKAVASLMSRVGTVKPS